jgi:hypothetical protein
MNERLDGGQECATVVSVSLVLLSVRTGMLSRDLLFTEFQWLV